MISITSCFEPSPLRGVRKSTDLNRHRVVVAVAAQRRRLVYAASASAVALTADCCGSEDVGKGWRQCAGDGAAGKAGKAGKASKAWQGCLG